LAYLLIVVVLRCPYCCLGEAAGAPVAHSPTDGCSYSLEHDSSDGHTPSLPCNCDHDCFCHGAIVDCLRLAELDGPTSLSAHWLCKGEELFSTNLAWATPSFEPFHHFPSRSTGRDVCALKRALLL